VAATTQLIVRMDPIEKKRVVKDAKRSDRTLSDYVRAKLLTDDLTEEESMLQSVLAELRPTVESALRSIDANLLAIQELRNQAEGRTTGVADRARKELDADELAAVAERLQLATHSATRRTRR
jgi:hypothetical protein